MAIQPDFPAILAQFKLQGQPAEPTPFGSGHIHDTFRVVNQAAGAPDYILQRVNHQVFRNVPGLMQNMQRVIGHLRHKLAAIPGAAPDREVLTLIPTHSGQAWYQDGSGNFWRMFLLLTDTHSYDLVETPAQAYEGGRGIGRFLALLADLPAAELVETIPDFHNVISRLQLFEAAVAADAAGRVKTMLPEIQFIRDRAQVMATIYHWGQAGRLPLRTTHNDTKFNNVLLDARDQAQCVIDLDTVMPGYVAYDFGDAIRTSVNTAAEDEADLTKIQVNLELFRAFTQGFLGEISSILTEDEVRSLAPGVTLLPYIMGMRFLTDYLAGDTYYKIHFPDHNRQRARAQFQLVRQLEACYAQLEKIIGETYQAQLPSSKAF